MKEKAVKFYEDKEALFPEPETIREIERVVLLKVIDRKWMDHIDDMDQLKHGIGLQAYGQKDPVVQYKMMGYDMFDEMTRAITEDTVRLLMHIQVEDYMQLVPADLKEEFTVKDFAMAAGVSVEASRYTLNILNYLEIVKRTGRVKNGYVYNVTEEF